MRNARLDELQGGIKIGRRNINNLRYADDTTLTAESKEERKGLLMRVKECETASLKLNIRKTKIIASSSSAAEAAKSLQSCLTLCDPIDGSSTGSPIPGILQARTFPGSFAFSKSNLDITSSLPLLPSSILDTFRPGGLIFWCHIFLFFYTVPEVLMASTLGWFAIPSSNESHFVRTLHCDPSVLGGFTQYGS